jgi:hypothetical protein
MNDPITDQITGKQLWQKFLGAKLPGDQLKQLGHDLFFARPAPTGPARIAVDSMAKIFAMQPAYLYQAFNTDPGRRVLEQLAYDYQNNIPWERVNSMTSGYIDRIAARIVIIRRAASGPKPPAAGAGVTITAATVAPQGEKKTVQNAMTELKAISIAFIVAGIAGITLILRGQPKLTLKTT